MGMTYVYLIAASFIGSLLNAVSGFGYGIIAVASYSMLLSVNDAVSVSAVINCVLSILIAGTNFRAIKWRTILAPMPVCFICAYLGLRCASGLADSNARKIVGCVLIVLAVVFLSNRTIRIKPSLPGSIAAGGIGGFFQGLCGIGGPPMVLYLVNTIEDKESYIATCQAYFITINVVLLFMRYCEGLVTAGCWKMAGICTVPVTVAVYIGSKLRSKVSDATVKKIVYWIVALAGAYFVIGEFF